MKSIPLGLDDGHYNIKIVDPQGGCHLVASRVEPGRSKYTSMIGGGNDNAPAEYIIDDARYIAGDRVSGEDTAFDEYPYSELVRVLVHHALLKSGFGGQMVDIATGLPIKRYYQSGEGGYSRNESLIEKKIRNLQGPIKAASEEALATIGKHEVLPEGFASWFDLIIRVSPDGRVERDREIERLPIAFVDIGGRTTDYAIIEDRMVQARDSGSINKGMLDIRKELSKLIADKYDVELHPLVIEKAIQTGTVRFQGKDVDVSQYVRMARKEVLESIRNQTRSRLGKGAELERIVFIGGGVEALKDDIVDWFPHQQIHERPVFANALGMQKYAQYVAPAV